MKKRDKKSGTFIKLGLVIVLIILGFFGVRHLIYRGTNEFKLKEIGYSTSEIKTIEKEFKNNQISNLLKKEYDPNISKFIKEDFFIYNNLDRYLKLKNKEKDRSNTDIVGMVNANTDKDFYSDIKDVDTSKGNLMLVNKFYKLSKEYTPENIEPIKDWYAYADQKITKEVLDAYLEMWNAADDEGLTLIVGSSYRDYTFQEELYNGFYNSSGQEYADNYSARPGHSEHQSGLALDIVTYDTTMDNFDETDEYKWLEANSYKYGFILRYPKEKEHITGYLYEPWHYRYVGKKVAKEINDLDITFDEYYAYYVK